MKLQEIFDQLTAGEFSQLSIGGQDQGKINESNYKPVISHINLALTALYRRFPLKEGRVVVEVQPNQLTYPIKSEYAVSNRRSRQPVRFILDDTHAPFEDDINKIERVLSETGYEYGLNDINNPFAMSTPNMTTLVVPGAIVTPTSETPDWLRTTKLSVVYRASHPLIEIGLGLFDPNRVEIELPYTHLEALLWYIASRANNPVGMGAEFNAGNTYAQKYELACQELERHALRIDQGQTNLRLYQKGFV